MYPHDSVFFFDLFKQIRLVSNGICCVALLTFPKFIKKCVKPVRIPGIIEKQNLILKLKPHPSLDHLLGEINVFLKSRRLISVENYDETNKEVYAHDCLTLIFYLFM